ncbi:MAG: hypothetical protein ACC662_09350, partial [Planctomycetota bacterium]
MRSKHVRNALLCVLPWVLLALVLAGGSATAGRGGKKRVGPGAWEPIGLSGGGGMFGPAISPVDGRRMIVHCDMGGVYRTEDAGRTWSMIPWREISSNTRSVPAWHPTEAD